MRGSRLMSLVKAHQHCDRLRRRGAVAGTGLPDLRGRCPRAPASAPQTGCVCQPVASTTRAIVAPSGRLGIMISRAYSVPARASPRSGPVRVAEAPSAPAAGHWTRPGASSLYGPLWRAAGLQLALTGSSRLPGPLSPRLRSTRGSSGIPRPRPPACG